MSTAPWFDQAKKLEGVREIVGSRHEAKVVKFFEEAGFAGVKDDETAWCAAFANAMLRRAGYKGTGSLAARSFLNYGQKLNEPKPGCIVVFKRGSSSWQGHVAFFVRQQGGKIYVLGGNQSNAVNVSGYDADDLLGFRWPTTKLAEVAKREKPLIQSKQAQAGGTIASIEAIDVVTKGKEIVTQVSEAKQTADGAGLTDYIVALASNPRIIIGVIVILGVGAMIYWRWRDHGRGSLRAKGPLDFLKFWQWGRA